MSGELKEGMEAPEFCLRDANEREHCLKDFAGKWVVLYFYPKDNTSGCTKEAVGFTEKKAEFEKLGAEIIGISPDSPKSHGRFIEKHDLKILLLSDPEREVLKKYGVWQKKKMYGREYMGVIRNTFLIDPKGKIAAIWRKVKVKGHIDEVLDKLKSMQ
jgi:peroxiredoxin Q/BCP